MKKFILKIIWLPIVFIIVLLFAFYYFHFLNHEEMIVNEPTNIKNLKMSEIQPLKDNEFWDVSGDGHHIFLTKREDYYIEKVFYETDTGIRGHYLRNTHVGEFIMDKLSYDIKQNYIIKEAFYLNRRIYVIGDSITDSDAYDPKIYVSEGIDKLIEINHFEDRKTYGTYFYNEGIIVITDKRILYYKNLKENPEVLWEGTWNGYTPFTCAIKKDILYMGGNPYICEFNLKDKTMNFLYPAQ